MMRLGLGIFLAAALALGGVPALASTVDFTATHDLSFSLNLTPTRTASTVRSSVYGETYGNDPEYATLSKSALANPPVTATANPSLSDENLVMENTYTKYTGYAGGVYSGVIYHQLTGQGPAPNGLNDPNSPDILQSNYYSVGLNTYNQKWVMDFKVVTAGVYTMTMADTYTTSFSMDQTTGSDYPFYAMKASSYIHMLTQTSVGNYADIASIILSLDQNNYPNPLSPINETRTLVANISPPQWTLAVNDLIHVEIYLVDLYQGWTMDNPPPVTPLPSTLLLGGSGLLGLVAWGWRKK